MGRLTKKDKVKYLTFAIILLAIIGYVIWDISATGPLTSLFSNREQLILVVQKLGPFAPIAYMGLQILQTIIAPIPGNLVGGIGGFLFGWWGVLWTLIGSTIGATLVFWISRRYGRGLVEKIADKKALKKFDFVLNNKRASRILFLIFLIPGLPDDAVCYLAGLTDVPIKKLIVIFAIGRLPAIVGNNYIGMGLESGNYTLVAVASFLAVLLIMVIYWQQDTIMHLLKKEYKTSSERKVKKKIIQDMADDYKINNSIAKKKK